MIYRDRYADLANMTDAQLKQHCLSKGIKEGRASSPVFDLQFYLNNNPDLKEAFGTDYEAVYIHYITKGYKERRKTSALFDGAYYCDNNPDVAANYKENFLLHYIDHPWRCGWKRHREFHRLSENQGSGSGALRIERSRADCGGY